MLLTKPTLWANPDFLKFWIASTISTFGDFFTIFALPLLVLAITNSPFDTGANMAVNTLPYLLISPFAGVLVDRKNRRAIMLVTRLLQTIFIVSIPLAYFFNVLTLWQLFVVSFIMGSLGVLFGAANTSALPSLVEKSQLIDANAKLTLSSSLAQLIAPALAGLLVTATNQPALALGVDASSFALAFLLILTIKKPFQQVRTGKSTSTVLADLQEGFRYLWQQPIIRTTAFLLLLFNVFLGGIIAELAVFGKQGLQLDDFGISLLYAGEGIGSIIASFVADKVSRGKPGHVILIMLLVVALSLMGLAVSPNLIVALAALTLMGLAATILFVNLVVLRQKIVPDNLQGRVNSTSRALAAGGTPFGALIAGALYNPLHNIQTVYLILALCAVAVALFALFTPLRHTSFAE